jgi:hypothetical protein
MKVRYGEEVANHSGPESCVCAREGAGEVLTGEIDREPGDAHHVYRRPVYRWYPIRRLSHINRGRGGLAANSTAGFEISPDQENVVTVPPMVVPPMVPSSMLTKEDAWKSGNGPATPGRGVSGVEIGLDEINSKSAFPPYVAGLGLPPLIPVNSPQHSRRRVRIDSTL